MKDLTHKKVIHIKKILPYVYKLIIVILMQFIIFFIVGIPLIFYGPFTNLKELVVTSAMTTLSHQYIATTFLSKQEVERIMKKNSIDTSEAKSDTNAIAVFSSKHSDNQLQITEDDKIDFIDISSDKFKGYLLIIRNPNRIAVGSTNSLGSIGMLLEDMVKKYNAVGGINAGGFEDKDGVGTGGIPMGLLVENGKVLYGQENERYDVIGFNDESVLMLGQYTLQEIRSNKIRDAVSFQPYLIVNGEPMIKDGNGGWGIAPRTAIGQRKDGSVLFLVIDGRQITSIGATLKEVQDILLKYGAYNAANLDGGASTEMIYNDKIVNHPCSQYGPRYIPSAFIIKQAQ